MGFPPWHSYAMRLRGRETGRGWVGCLTGDNDVMCFVVDNEKVMNKSDHVIYNTVQPSVK